MIKYTYNDVTIKNKVRIIFLCGVKFKKNDKRTILKEYLEKNPFNKVIILEEVFDFKKSKQDKYKLIYKSINLESLFDIENLTAFLSDAIFIIHESLSTAAEIGVFASNKDLCNKICLITPNEINVEEDKLKGFINLAFRNNFLSIPNIEFFPSVTISRRSQNMNNYYTHFYEDKIGVLLGKNINEFICKTIKDEIELKYVESKYKNVISGKNSYYIENKNGKTYICCNINYSTLKYYIIALFSIDEFKREIRRKKDIKSSINLVKQWHNNILLNTISEKKGISNFEAEFKIVGSNINGINIDKGIAFILYVLHAVKFIELPINSKKKFVIRQNFLELCKNSFNNIISKDEYREDI